MVFPGMRATNDYGSDERPKNYREGILLNEPRNKAPLYALTSMMPSKSTDDPEYAWWEEQEEMFGFTISADIDNAVTTIPVTSGATKLKPGDIIMMKATGEQMRIATIASDTSITVTRAWGTVAATAIDIPAAAADFFYIGSAYREGAGRAQGTSWNPTKKYNYTQIFRTPVEWTRTAMKTRLRTGDTMREDKRRMLNKHSIGIEQALWFGQRKETTESSQPLRSTAGFLSFIDSGNVSTMTAGGIDMDELESKMEGIFAWGSSEKVAWASVKTLIIINQIIRKNTHYCWEQGTTEYGMSVKRLITPAGTLAFTEHPLFSQAGGYLNNDLVVMDTADLVYRYLDDTTYLKDREDKGVDGKAEEWLSEIGLEVHHGKHHSWLKGFLTAAIDD